MVVETINKLRGKEVTRKQVKMLLSQAMREEQTYIHDKLKAVLAKYPEQKTFVFSTATPFIEQVPVSMLNGLYHELEEADENQGLGKAVSANDVYQLITDRFIQMVKEANAGDWKQPWEGKFYGRGYLIPFNFVSKKAYRGVNRYLLAGFRPMLNPFFLTFAQVEQLKGKVKKGAHGHPVVYFTYLYKYENAEKKIDIAAYDKEKFIGQLKAAGIPNPEHVAAVSKLPILKYYNVFNGADIEGIDFDLENWKAGFVEKPIPAMEENKMPIAEAIIKSYPKPKPSMEFGGNEAFFSPGKDHVQMPYIIDFNTAQEYYTTFFHELVHSTGHEKRLNRFKPVTTKKDYAFEELVAEFGASFLSAEAGILWHTSKNTASYLKGWNSALTFLEDDNRFLMRAATQAQAAADYVLNHDHDGQPAYTPYLLKMTHKKQKAENAELFNNKPKSTNIATAVKDVLSTGKYDDIKELQATLLYNFTKNVADVSEEEIKIKTKQFQRAILNSIPDGYVYYYEGITEGEDEITLYSDGVNLVNAIRNRLETLKTQKNNPQLFDGLRAPIEPVQVEEIEVTEPEEVETEPEAVLQTIKQEYVEPEKEQVTVPAKEVSSDNPLLISSNDLMNMEFDTLQFSGKWKEFMQEPAKNMKIAIWGKPKNGKTSGACALAEYLTCYGNVLYNFADQGINKSTQDIWRNSGLDKNSRAFCTGANTLDDLEKLVSSGDFDFVFIDMINHYIDHEKLKPYQFKERFIQRYSNVSFILVMEVNKNGNFKGDQGWTHIVDALVTVENFLMENRGRYGVGHYVVWEDGFKKFDPDKYSELFEETQTAMSEQPVPVTKTDYDDVLAKLNFKTN